MPLCLETRKHANVSRFSDLLQQKRCDWISSRGYQQRDLFRARGMTFLEDALSLPGLSFELLFQFKDQDTRFFVLFNNKHADLHTRIKQNIVGGPSIVWNRLAVKNETKIRPHDYPDAKAVKTNLGYDASSLCLYCIGQDIPIGYFHRRQAECNFRLEKKLSLKPSSVGLVKLCKRFRAYFRSARRQ